jgi:UDP:flavonoid glycosyltransferase YjiC (YdhE family)
MGRDQADVSARVVWRGAGLKLSTRARVGTIRSTIACVLAEPAFRAAARRVAEGMTTGRDDLAVQELEGLAAARR